jgi:hypothetical protein
MRTVLRGLTFCLIICIHLRIAFLSDTAGQDSTVIRLTPAVDAINISWPCSMVFESASLDYVSVPSSYIAHHSGTSSVSVENCCGGAQTYCEWVLSPLLPDATYSMTLFVFKKSDPNANNSNPDTPYIYHLTASTVSAFVSSPPSVSFACDGLALSWFAASPPITSSPLQLQQLVAFRSGPAIDRNDILLLDLPATQNVARLPLPLPSMLSGTSIQFAVISHFGAKPNGILTNRSSSPSLRVNISEGESQVSDIATVAGMQAFADSNSVTVLFKSAPAFAYVVLFSVSDFLLIGCNRSSSITKIGNTSDAGCIGCGFQKASRSVTFEPLPSQTDWIVALCIPSALPPSPCSDTPSVLTTAATIAVRTSNSSQSHAPEIIDAKTVAHGIRVCWRHVFSESLGWIVSVRFSNNSSVTFTKQPAEVIIDGCTLSRSCLFCSDFPLDVVSLCSVQNNSNAVMTVTQLPASSQQILNRPSSGYPVFSVCTPPLPNVTACLMSHSSEVDHGIINISWPRQPVMVKRVFVYVYHLDDAGRVTTIHNTSVPASPLHILLPLPLDLSCCLVARSATLSNVLSGTSVPICGLQVNLVV